jgi:predicted permease
MVLRVWSELRAAVRALGHARGFTAIAVATLGLGLALSITIFTIVNAYLIRPLPYPAADRLYDVQYAAPGQPSPRGMAALPWDSLGDVVEHAIAWDLDVFYMLGGAHPEAMPGAWVTPGFVRALGVGAAMGRAIADDDFEPGRPPVAVISHRLWQSRFGGDPSAIGRSFQAYVSDRPDEAETFTIVGVMPNEFWHLNAYTEVLAPLRARAYPYMLRLREGVTAEQAGERVSALVRSAGGELPPGWRATLISTQQRYVAAVRPLVLAVGAAAALVLLIACANLAVLLLVRGHRRQHELAIRLSLGASQGRLVRAMGLEAAIIGAAATIIGLALSRAAVAGLAPLIERHLQRRAPGGAAAAFGLDPTVWLAAAAGGVAATLAFAAAPVLMARHASLASTIGGAGRGASERRGARRTRSILIALEVAASLALLAGSALMIDSGLRMLRVDFGVRGEGVAITSVGLRDRSYPDAARRGAFFERLLERLSAIDGAGEAAVGEWFPLQQTQARGLQVEGDSGPISVSATVFGASDRYFAVLGVPIREGRSFGAADRRGGEPVAIVSASLAARVWPDEGAVGRRIRVPASAAPDAPAIAHTVVGVAADVKQSHGDRDTLDVFVPFHERASRFAFLYVKARQAGNAAASVAGTIRDVVSSIDAEVAVAEVRGLDDWLDQERARPRFLAQLLTGLAGFAAGLALIGIYGIVAYAARQREREIAVRMAVGADRRSVTGLLVRQGGLVLACGLIAGVAGAAALGRVLESQLFGVAPGDPFVLGGSALAVAAAGLAAIWWPAHRAASIDPALLLKEI